MIYQTEREEMISQIYKEIIEKRDEEIRELRLLLKLNKKYLKYTNLSTIQGSFKDRWLSSKR